MPRRPDAVVLSRSDGAGHGDLTGFAGATAEFTHSLRRRAHGDCNTMRACNAMTSPTTCRPT
jgi:hypothetical protein